jgi:hypothetical protein
MTTFIGEWLILPKGRGVKEHLELYIIRSSKFT